MLQPTELSIISQMSPVLLNLLLFFIYCSSAWNESPSPQPSISSLDKWFFKCGEQSSSNSITLELVRNSNSQPYARPTELENSGLSSNNLWLNKHSDPNAGWSLRPCFRDNFHFNHLNSPSGESLLLPCCAPWARYPPICLYIMALSWYLSLYFSAYWFACLSF